MIARKTSEHNYNGSIITDTGDPGAAQTKILQKQKETGINASLP